MVYQILYVESKTSLEVRRVKKICYFAMCLKKHTRNYDFAMCQEKHTTKFDF
jgi:hypothetical protein